MRRLLLAAAVLLGLAPGLFAAPDISGAVNTRIKDLRASATLGEADLEVLAKIGKDYANAYRAKAMETYFKEPGRIRFEAKAIGITFTQVINGNTQYTSVLGLKRKTVVSTRPMNRQGSMEIGFVTPSALKDFTAKFLRQERFAQVFELRYKQRDLRDRKMLVWLDPAKKVLVRRELYHGDGRLKARFNYSTPKEAAPGIWIPTRITVQNGQGAFGGATTYGNFRVNTGLSESLFSGI